MLVYQLQHFDYLPCEECKGELVNSQGLTVCRNCGLVHDPVIESERLCCSEKSQEYNLLSDKLTYTHTKRDYSDQCITRFGYIYKRLKQLCAQIHLTKTATLRVLHLTKNCKFNEHPISAYAVAIVIQICKEEKLLIPRREILRESKELGLKMNYASVNKATIQLNAKTRITVYDYITLFEAKLLQNTELTRQTDEVLKYADLKKKQFQGFKPSNFAIACLYNVYKHKGITWKIVGETFSINVKSGYLAMIAKKIRLLEESV